MRKDKDLLPCPICNSEAQYEISVWKESFPGGPNGDGIYYESDSYFASCSNKCPIVMNGCRSKEEAIKAWNDLWKKKPGAS